MSASELRPVMTVEDFGEAPIHARGELPLAVASGGNFLSRVGCELTRAGVKAADSTSERR